MPENMELVAEHQDLHLIGLLGSKREDDELEEATQAH
jgi:hypothetical protein